MTEDRVAKAIELLDENGDDIVARLENLATKMFQSGNWGADLDTVKAAMDTIVDIRIDLHRAENRVARAIELLERIAAHDHQGAATRVLLNSPSGTVERLAVYADRLREVAKTDIQGWAQQALLHLRGEDQ